MFSKRSLVIVAIIVAIGGFFYYRSRTATVVIPTETVRRGDIVETVSVTGDLVPTEFSDLSFQAVGRIDAVSAKEGDAVQKGEILASVDTSVLESQLKDAQVAALIAVQNERAARLHMKSLLLHSEDVKAKKLASEQAREKVRTIAAELAQSNLISPMDGFISKEDIRVGETVIAGNVVARVVMNPDLIVEARVPESDIVKVILGMKAKVTFDALSSDDVFGAEVTEIDKAATVVQDVVSYVVKFRLENVDSRLKEGMTVNVDIVTAQAKDALTVPFRALTKENEKTYADVKQTDGTFKHVEVSVGIEGDDGMIEVKSGLNEGDEVTLGTKQAN